MLTTYTIHSASPKAPPLVLLHAFPLSSVMWAPTLNILAEKAPERDYHTIEFPGFGLSDSAQSWTMEQFARDLKGMFDSLNLDRAVIAGISMGGYAAFEFYRAFPNRVAGLLAVRIFELRVEPERITHLVARRRADELQLV